MMSDIHFLMSFPAKSLDFAPFYRDATSSVWSQQKPTVEWFSLEAKSEKKQLSLRSYFLLCK